MSQPASNELTYERAIAAPKRLGQNRILKELQRLSQEGLGETRKGIRVLGHDLAVLCWSVTRIGKEPWHTQVGSEMKQNLEFQNLNGIK